MIRQEDAVGEGRKYCPQCQRHKRIEEFGKHSKRPDGLQSWCRFCRSTGGQKKRVESAQSTIAALERQDDGGPFESWWPREKKIRRAQRTVELSDVEGETLWNDPRIRDRYVWAEIKRDTEHRGGDPNDIYADALRILDRTLYESESPEEADDLVEEAIRRAMRRDIVRRLDG